MFKYKIVGVKELSVEHILMFVIVAFVLYHMMGMRSCGCRGDGFSIGIPVETNCKTHEDDLILEFKDFEKRYHSWGYDPKKKVWINPAGKWNGGSYKEMAKEILTPGCDFQKKYFTRDSTGIINGISSDTIEQYFPITN